MNPVSIWVETFRLLTLGDLYPTTRSLITLLLQSISAWFIGFLAVFVPLLVRRYRRT